MGNNKRPDIRFSGFSQNWEVNRLGEIYNVYSGQTPSRSNLSNFNNPTTAWIKTTDLNNSSIKVNQENISKKAAEKLKILKEDTVLIAMYGGFNQIGRTGILTYPATINQALSALEPIEKINPYFLLTVLNYKVNEWKRLAASSRKDPNITKRDVEDFLLRYPLFQEQVKLGGFFKNLDNAISLQQQELTILKQTKQGFLQKMFPKEGEAVPEVRFPGFLDNWKVYKLADITTLITKGTTPKDKYSKGDVNLIKVENIDSYSGVITLTSKVSKEEHEGYLKRSQLKADDILFSIAGTLGRTSIVKEGILPANTNQALAIIRLKNGNTGFVETYLKGRSVEEYIKRNPTVGAQPNLSLAQLGNLTIKLPSSQEQEAISKFFKGIDKVISISQQELEALQQTKKAFLQKMFV